MGGRTDGGEEIGGYTDGISSRGTNRRGRCIGRNSRRRGAGGGLWLGATVTDLLVTCGVPPDDGSA